MFGCLLIPSTPSPSTTPAVALASEQTLDVNGFLTGVFRLAFHAAIKFCAHVLCAKISPQHGQGEGHEKGRFR